MRWICFACVALMACSSSTSYSQPPPPPNPVPDSLQGNWHTVLTGTAEQVTLTLSVNNYLIVRGPNRATGAAAVIADTIQFSQSSACNGTGVYQWGLFRDSLSFAIHADPCPGRSAVLNGQVYGKSAP